MTSGADNPAVTPAILAEDRTRLAANIAAGDKGAAIGTFYQLGLNVGSFIEQQGDTLSAEVKRELLAGLLTQAAEIEALAGEMDQGDEYMWGECMDHLQMSVTDRCPELLRDGKLVLGAPQTTNNPVGASAPSTDRQP